MAQDRARKAQGGREAPPPLPTAGDAVIDALSELTAMEHRLEVLHQRLLEVPLARDTMDPAELAIENLLLDVGAARYRVLAARLTATYGARRIGRLPKEGEIR